MGMLRESSSPFETLFFGFGEVALIVAFYPAAISIIDSDFALI